ncbi:prefoldin subunit [Russula decolorans]|jgi:prefoldin subunit 5
MSTSKAPPDIVQEGEKNPRGIPKAIFINDVEEYLGGPDAAVERVLSAFQDALAKYRYMDSNLAQRRRGLEEKIPDIRKTLNMVEFLRDRREGKKATKGSGAGDSDDDDDDELEHEHDENDGGKPVPIRTTFELADTLYAEAELEETDTVFLWLGANVMLSYKIPAAIELLKSKLEAATTSLNNAIEDLEFIREQMTVMEVNTARIYNWDVKRRREKREKEKLSGTGEIET